MSLTIDLWQFMSMLGAMVLLFLSFMYGAGRVLVSQFEKRLDERFIAQEEKRKDHQKHWDHKFNLLEQAALNEAKEWQRIEREVMKLKSELPIDYVRRDDFVLHQSRIEAKIDGLAIRLENTYFLKGDKNV